MPTILLSPAARIARSKVASGRRWHRPDQERAGRIDLLVEMARMCEDQAAEYRRQADELADEVQR